MNKLAGLSVMLLCAISTVAQTPKQQHFNLGMTIDEFAGQFDVTRTDTPDALYVNSAARTAMKGKRAVIQINADGARMALVFNKRTLREMDVTAGNTFQHEFQVLSEDLGEPTVSRINLAVWDREDGTRFKLTSHEGTGVLLITPVPSHAKIDRENRG